MRILPEGPRNPSLSRAANGLSSLSCAGPPPLPGNASGVFAPCAAERGIFPELRWYHGHSVRPEPTVNQPARGVFCSMREPSGPAEHKGGAEYEAGQIGGGTFSGTACGLCHRKPRADGARRLHERRRKRYLFPVSALAPRHPQAGADHPRRDGCDWRTGGVHACGAARRAVGGIGPICERGEASCCVSKTAQALPWCWA